MIGTNLHLSIFGESHGEAIGCVLENFPAGVAVDMEAVSLQMARRAPGRDPTATARKEADAPQIISGILNGVTTGAPLTALIRNTNQRSGDYKNITEDFLPRPGHADYPAYLRYGGHADLRGGGHFSGRLTAPLVFAGSLCRQLLKANGVTVGGHIASVGSVSDTPFDPVRVSSEQLDALSASPLALLDPAAEAPIRAEIEAARLAADSVGGIVELAAVGLPGGIGSPLFESAESRLSAILFGIPAVKGIEFGDGFALAAMRGSKANDPYILGNGQIRTSSNHNGGILGGITTGMPLILRLAVKPTPSIGQPQQTVNPVTGEPGTLTVKGRHDPCIVPRALPAAEAALAFGLLDILLDHPAL